MSEPRHRQILAWLIERERGVLIPELTVFTAVADLAAVDEHELRLYEIKSSGDKLERLEMQMRQYRAIGDRVTLVAAENQLTAIERLEERTGREIVPEWVGVTVVCEHGLEELREARPNPEKNKAIIASLLWKPEAMRELKLRGIEPSPRNARRYHQHELAESLEMDELCAIVRRCISARDWSGSMGWNKENRRMEFIPRKFEVVYKTGGRQ